MLLGGPFVAIAASGLAYRILEAGYRLEIPRMFAALVLLAITLLVNMVGAFIVSRSSAGLTGGAR